MRRLVLGSLALMAAGVIAAGCASSKGATRGGTASTMQAAPAAIGTANSKVGMILVGRNGRSLYLFEKDKPDMSACSGACAAAWPVAHSNGQPKAGSGVNASMLGTMKRTDGTTQATYNKHPLYYFSGDTSAGQVHGQNVSAFGAKWFAMTPSGNAAKSGSS
jgi:predicted lipoprotein with Yx(FWY)xxD motif